ncbi:hypothetical protein LTR62_002287 [Meristemomyces frigidus]|uniref:Uncharacterized protein n=1 Tax=Meristemomyces frigidus TaxID=1508187 RepID=A0AAN7TG79_9PEZI|nr:hypothetical protein LTR62_002287 [Meristemomyces frigidus]
MAAYMQYKAPGTQHFASGTDFVPTLHNDTYDFIKPEQFDLKDRAVLITGASKGIGRATAISFARAGASKIAVGARSSLDSLKDEIEAAAQKAGRATPQVITLKLDVSDYDSAANSANEIEQAFGRLDILVNNGGYLETFHKLLDTDPKEFRTSVETNLLGVYHVTRACLGLMLKTPNGLKEVVQLSSIGANVVSATGYAYKSSKLGVQRFTEMLGVDYPEVLAFSVHPGGVLTDLAKGMGKHMEKFLIDTPQLAADAMVWLTAERRDFLQGRYIACTWDMKELLEKRSKIEEQDLLKVKLRVD